MRKTISGVIILAIFLLPLVAVADNMEAQKYKDPYYRVGPCGGASDPTWNGVMPNPWTWTGWTAGNPAPNLTIIGQNQCLSMGFENWRIVVWEKFVTVHIEYTGAGRPSVKTPHFGNRPGTIASSGNLDAITKDILPGVNPGVYEFRYHIIHQPDWEWFDIEAQNGGITITKATISSWCKPIPALSGWGLAMLVVLLAGTAVWVVRRKRAVAAV